MKHEAQEFSNRFHIVAGIFILAALIILVRLVYVDFSGQRGEFTDRTEDWSKGYHIFYPPRGNIYDRFGRLLAGSEEAYEVGVDLNTVYRTGNQEAIVFTLKSVLVDHPTAIYMGRADFEDFLMNQVSVTPSITNSYRMLADNVTQAQLDEIKRWSERYASLKLSKSKDAPVQSLAGLVYRPRMKRVYPEGTLASNILGYVEFSGIGKNGVEEVYNDLLAGIPEPTLYDRNPLNADEMPAIPKGTDLVLTIDRDIQAAVEKILDKAVQNTGSTSGTVLVMNPKNGEMLAIATSSQVDPNRFWEAYQHMEVGGSYNRAVNSIYEPGSVFKVLTMAAALNEGTVTPDTTFFDPGSINVGGVNIINWDHAGHGEQTMTGCMRLSLNVCLAWVATQLGAEKFYQYIDAFGIGHLTGVDMAGEVQGLVRKPGDRIWYDEDLGTNSYGQGLAVTPIQMVQAISAVANGGQMTSPHVLRSQISDGRQYNPIRPVVGMPISAQTASTLTEMLAWSLEQEASNALVNGYRVAGKTGTASVPTPTGYSDSFTNASFVGWGPADDPSILIYVWLEKPTSDIWGSVVAAPVFSDVFKQVAIMTKLPPDAIRQQITHSSSSASVASDNK